MNESRIVLIVLSMLSLFSLVITSCTPYYGIGNVASQSRYASKPAYKDSVRTAVYASGQYYNNLSNGYFPDEPSYFGDIALNISHTAKYYNASAGVFGYMGKYHVNFIDQNDIDDFYMVFDDFSFYGGGFFIDLNLNYPITKNIDWRPLGVRYAITAEGGEFSDFREELNKKYKREKTENNMSFLAATHEFIYKFDNSIIGLFSMAGISDRKIYNISNTMYYNFDKITIYAQLNYWEIGVLEFNPNITRAIISFGLSYRIFNY